MGTHSKYAPSSCKRWVNCPGSIGLIDSLPEKEEESNFYADEGTVAHQLANDCLFLGAQTKDFLGDKPVEGIDIAVDSEMVKHVQTYVSFVRDETPEDAGKSITKVEEKVTIFEEDEVYGTVDYVLFTAAYEELTVIDLKYGQGVKVDADENEQLMAYTVGLLKTFPNVDKIRLIIVQPRAREGHPISIWSTTRNRITAFGKLMKKAIKESKKKNPTFKAGDHCKWCPGKAVCPEMMKTALDVARADFETDVVEYTPPVITTLTADRISFILEMDKPIRDFLTSVKEYAKTQIEGGMKVDGWEIGDGRSTRVWKDEKNVIKELTSFFGEEIYEPKKLLSPAQMEVLGDDKKTMKEIVSALVEKKPGNKTIKKTKGA